jgi:hypothetical protein
MDPFVELTLWISPQELTKNVDGIGVFFFPKIIMADVKQALFPPWGGKKL